jgi:hypothetical protein
MTSPRLAILAAEIKTALTIAMRHGQATLSALMDAGDRLKEAKDSLDYGEWDDWLRSNFDLSDRSARLYMQLAAHRARVEARMATVAVLGIRGALQVIAEDQEQEGCERRNRELLAMELERRSRPDYQATVAMMARPSCRDRCQREHDKNEMSKAVRHIIDHIEAARARFEESDFPKFRRQLIQGLDRLGINIRQRAKAVRRATKRTARRSSEQETARPSNQAEAAE